MVKKRKMKRKAAVKAVQVVVSAKALRSENAAKKKAIKAAMAEFKKSVNAAMKQFLAALV